MSAAPLSQANPTAYGSLKPIDGRVQKKEEKQPITARLSVRDGIITAAVPTILGTGTAAKIYFERKGKFSVYKDLMNKFADGTPEHANFKDCTDIMKKSMRDAKFCGLFVAAAGVITAGTFAIIKKVKTNSEKAQAQNKFSNPSAASAQNNSQEKSTNITA